VNDESDERRSAAARRTLGLLQRQADEVRTELTKLRARLAEMRNGFGGTRGLQLLEANEHLVLSALQAQTIAENAASRLGEVTRASQRDALTDTPNRVLMFDLLDHAIAMAHRHGTRIAVLFIDLDDFKQINDTLGHAVGDLVLQDVARRLMASVRESDTVSRHGGDEFLVLLTDLSRPSDAGTTAAKILSALAEPRPVGEHVLSISASIGISFYPDDGEDAATLIHGADNAMFHSKRRERGGFEFHRKDMNDERSTRWLVIDGPPQAIASGSTGTQRHEPRSGDLREANEQLVKAALKAQDQGERAREAHEQQVRFMAMVAHELRNPLTPIRIAASLLVGRTAMDNPSLERLQAIIEAQVVHMSRLIDDLLDDSRVSTGKLRLESSTVDMVDILELAASTCRPAVDARSQRLVLELPPSPCAFCGDPVRLAQIFTNLLDNASKYTARGGEIAVSLVRLDGTIVISIRDNGIGISAEVLPTIFDLFVQDARALTLSNGGLGIGLAVVRELVLAHGGSIAGTSRGKDLGSEFVVTLPNVEALA
jgi:diguanylate cyclase (GGDEF)-like protein